MLKSKHSFLAQFTQLLIGFILSWNMTWAMETPTDPYLWLEDVEGKESLQWVKEQNARTVTELQSLQFYNEIHDKIKSIIFAKDRVPFSSFYKGHFWNFWQDKEHKQGILRRTTFEEYRKDEPTWETILDLDDLCQKENENWVYKGNTRLDKDSHLGLIRLSRGGKDAVVVREFNFDTKQFVNNGFYVPEAKTDVTPLNENQLLIGSDFGENSLTTSGYPRTIRLWNRNEFLTKAKTIFEAKETDLTANATLIRDGKKRHILLIRTIDFYNQETFLYEGDDSLRQLPIPSTASLLGIKDSKVYLQLKEDLKIGDRNISSNSILRFHLDDRSLLDSQVIFTAQPGQSIEEVSVERDRIFVTLLDQVRSRVLEVKLNLSGEWTTSTLPFPATGVISFNRRDDEDLTDITTLTYTDHLTPSSQYLVHDQDGSYQLELLKNSPHRFDSSQFEVIQNFAISRDGTRVPYFVIKQKDLVLDGSHPAILYGYGGFEISLTPSYSATIGKVWLERGGVYAVANIRGGGEYGPQWHQAALKENRQRAYDDFIAIAEDLISRGFTSPSHLGIKGGSNGGLLVGATLVQRPDLFNAALAQVPLLDMVRYSHLLAGASWIGEYGNPDEPNELPYLLAYSPYHNVHADRQYPKVMFTTSTKDDRVHPGHARKMAARMMEQEHPFYYYENINGGHAGSANLEESAFMAALEYTYLWNQLR